MRWNLGQRIAFRFACLYLPLYYVPSLLTEFADRWVAARFFNLIVPADRQPTGSGDTALDYVHVVPLLVISLAGTLVWSLLDRRRENYTALHGWLRLAMRYILASILFSYGFAKVFPTQFQPAGFTRLIEPFGDFSPMGVLWSFMGASMAYTIFAGASEVAGAVLLLFRRTTLLGAMVSAGVLLNVVMLNFSYDVPVKLYSAHLLATAVFLMAPDMARLWNFLVMRRAVDAVADAGPSLNVLALRIAGWVARGLFVVMILGRGFSGYTAYRQNENRARPPLYGLYEVASQADDRDWRHVAFEFPGFVQIRTRTGRVFGFATAYDEPAGLVKVMLNGQTYPLHYSREGDELALEGRLFDGDLNVRMRRVDLSAFPLLNRGFHWVQEFPFNR